MLPADSEFRQWESIERLIYKIANQVHTRVKAAGLQSRIGLDDLVQEGATTWVLSMEKFKPEFGFAFSTYLTRSVYTNLNRYVSKHGNIKGEQTYGYVSLNETIGESTSEMGDLMPDETTPSAGDLIDLQDTIERRMNSLSPITRQVYKWMINPPAWFIAECKAAKAFAKKAHAQGVSRSVAGPTEVVLIASLLRTVWGLDDRQVKRVRAELGALK